MKWASPQMQPPVLVACRWASMLHSLAPPCSASSYQIACVAELALARSTAYAMMDLRSYTSSSPHLRLTRYTRSHREVWCGAATGITLQHLFTDCSSRSVIMAMYFPHDYMAPQ